MLTFLIPSAKEMTIPPRSYPHVLPQKSQAILNTMSEMTVEQLAKAYQIKEEAALKEYQRWQQMAANQSSAYPAYQLFNGLMYRHIKRHNLSVQERNYLYQQVFISSSFYGIISADHKIAEHRHDFHTKITLDGTSLKAYWRSAYNLFAQEHPQVISLLSSEFEDVFTKDLRKLWISPKFMEEKKGQLKTHSTISKKARGAFLTACMEQNCQTLDSLKSLVFPGFYYDSSLSTDREFVYLKKED
ncbi:peroxide stress protein YaaA [Streptococcus castoreus]|uniref:peroxide stress protein YaaA n=1 Tax=Streptococcus castoreus TaxID=254786 RepID=UPI0004002679|nr:peroxide stress protein YaaA [Streptococcus castoreus]